ncbi:MAG: SpoIID/LytB domain-containing protein [Sedimentibacter sp.]|uniref:SpoIID/LytB domain-containing protein n=1 Tax=Sedimentibacter sp. TaxID=1960295 RepID=UPI002981F0B1|nr:SpoIID/LytB domain-containing protein [Sedimentibacter sp.]MDW5299903.1 SpoIID/LytB domain-containing protein [Sedimentibacter sp.]
MKKLMFKIAAISLITMLLLSVTCFGATDEDYYVRVRIRSPRLFNQQLSLDGYENITVYEGDDSPEELFTLDSKELSILIDSYYDGNYNYLESSEVAEAKYGPYHVMVNYSYSSYDDANDEAKDLENQFDEDFYPYYDSEGFKIYAGNFVDKSLAENLADELNENGTESYVINGNMENVAIYDNYNNMIFMYQNEQELFFSSFNDDASCNMAKIDGRPYRGLLTFKIIDDSKLISVNYLDLESYLYGVVPNEIVASWGMESLKAQAVAARTYAVYNINPYSSYGYDLEDNQNSQVYWGYAYEKNSTNEAVDSTRGEMIYYDNELIQAFYHSTSGGKTENSENVWFAALPYLVGVDDEYSDKSNSPYTQWQKTYAQDEIIKKLKSDGNNVSKLYGIEIKEVSENNRVVECIFLTDNGEISYKKENARLLLGLMSSWFTIENGSVFYFTNEETIESDKTGGNEDENEIPSRGGILDVITDEDEGNESNNDETYDAEESIKLDSGSILGKYAISSSGKKKVGQEKLAFISSSGVKIIDTNSTEYSFDGRGWGHGIGMSQYGAKEMAEEGFAYDEILKHYYTGVTIK